MRSLIMLAILANAAAGWADRLAVASQLGPGSFADPAIRAPAAKRVCALRNTEALEGNRLLQAGRFAEARTKLQSALETLEASDGPDPTNFACVMNMIGMSELQQRHLELAAQWFERGLKLNPRSDVLMALLTGNLASVYSQLNRLERGEELARQAIHLSERVFGADHPEGLFPQDNLGLYPHSSWRVCNCGTRPSPCSPCSRTELATNLLRGVHSGRESRLPLFRTAKIRSCPRAASEITFRSGT